MEHKQKVKIVDMTPCSVVVQFPDTGKTIKHPRSFFSKRLEMGVWEVDNPTALPKYI